MRDKIIAVDFDGTITFPSPFPITGKVRPDAVRVLSKLKKKYIILLWTARVGKYLDEAILELRKNGIEVDYINKLPGQQGNKPNADIFIDDRNFGCVIDWNEIENKLLGGDVCLQ